jgi:hypothetical protein
MASKIYRHLRSGFVPCCSQNSFSLNSKLQTVKRVGVPFEVTIVCGLCRHALEWGRNISSHMLLSGVSQVQISLGDVAEPPPSQLKPFLKFYMTGPCTLAHPHRYPPYKRAKNPAVIRLSGSILCLFHLLLSFIDDWISSPPLTVQNDMS